MTSSAAYSATPLARKLGIKPGHRLTLVAAPPAWSVPDLPDGVLVQRVRRAAQVAAPDVVLAFVRAASELAATLDAVGPAIFPDRALWVVWPRKAVGHVSDVTENGIRDAALPLGLVDVKVAALDADWSGLRLVWRKELRGGPVPA